MITWTHNCLYHARRDPGSVELGAVAQRDAVRRVAAPQQRRLVAGQAQRAQSVGHAVEVSRRQVEA